MGQFVDRCKKCFEAEEVKLFGMELEKLKETENDLHRTREESISEGKNELGIEVTSQQRMIEEFLELCTEENNLKFVEMTRKNDVPVYGTDCELGLIVKTTFPSKYTCFEFIDFLRDVNNRKSWDNYTENISETLGSDDESFITYYKFKKMLSISQREMVIESKVHSLFNRTLLLSQSIDHTSCLSLQSIQKINIYIGGYLFESAIDGNGRSYTKVTCVVKGDFGGPVPQTFLKKAVAMSLSRLHHSMSEAMNKYYE